MLIRSLRRGWLPGALAACIALCLGAACAEEIPAFEFAFGQPAIEPLVGYEYQYGDIESPPIAVDESSIYVGGRQINVFSREGEWQEFWPFSSFVRGLGVEGESFTAATDIALGPGERAYLLDRFNRAVHVYSTAGEFLGGWGGYGDGAEEFRQPTAICASPDGSVYVLDIARSRIARFTAEGALLNAWAVPTTPEGCVEQETLIAPAPGQGVWLLKAFVWWEPETESWLSAVQLHRFGADGGEEASWGIAPGPYWTRYGLATDPEGNVWVFDGGGDTGDRLRSYSPGGVILSQVTLGGGPFGREFVISSDSKLFLMGLDFFEASSPRYVVCQIQTRTLEGDVLGAFGGVFYMPSSGTLMAPLAVAEDVEGGTYVKVGRFRPSYIVHYDPDGERVETLETEEWPITDPSTGAVEFAPWPASYVGPEGAYSYCARDIYLRDLVVRGQVVSREWVADVYRCSVTARVQELAFRIPVGGLLPEAVLEGLVSSSWGLVQQTDDGNLVLAMELCSCTDDPVPMLWVAALTPDGTVLSSWVADDAANLFWPACATRDGGGNTYIGGYGVWKFGPTGQPIGRIGGWGGEGDQRDAPGSLVLQASGVLMDSEGRLTVLDYEANRVVVFRYTPGPFEDVPFYHWAKDFVIRAVHLDVIAGYDDGLFRPAEAITRAQMAAFVSRAMAGGDDNVPAGPAEPSFEDVPVDHWAYRYVEYVLAHGAVDVGPDGIYEPGGGVDRGDMAVFIARAIAGGDAGVPSGPTTPSFADVEADDAIYKYVEYLKQRGVVLGYADGWYHPEYVCLRDQVAVYVTRAWAHP